MKSSVLLKTFITLTFSSVLLLTSCKKSVLTPTATTTTPTTPSPGDADGVLAAVNVSASQTVGGITVPLNIGLGVAAFGSTSANFLAGTYTDAGAIACNSKSLTKQSGNSYIFQPSASAATGIDFASGVSWNVGGAGTIPAFTRTLGAVMPDAPSITSGTTVTKGSDYTLTINSVSGADSILFMIASGSKSIRKTLPGTATSCTFSGAETNTLDASNSAIIQADPFNYTSEVISGKKIYFVNESSYSLAGSKVQ